MQSESAMQAASDLARKLGIKAGSRVVAFNANPEILARIRRSAPADAIFLERLTASGKADIILFWPETKDGLAQLFERLKRAICPNGAVWAIIPKKTEKTDQQRVSFDQVQTAALWTDLVDNKIAAISETEYGIRFVVRKERRAICAQPRQEKSIT